MRNDRLQEAVSSGRLGGIAELQIGEGIGRMLSGR